MMRIYIAAIIASATLLCAAFVVHASTNIFSLDEKNYSAVMKTDSNGAETGEIVIYGRLENGQAFPETIVVKYSPDLKLGHEVPSTVCELLPHQKLRVADGQFIRCMVPSYDLEKGQSENEHPKAAPEQSPGGNQRQKAIPEQQQPGSENEHPKAAPEPSQGGNQQQANRPERAVPQQQQPGKEPPKQVEPQQSGGEAVEPGKEYVIEPAHLYYYRLCAKNNTTECSPSLPLYVMIMRGELDSDKDLVPDSLNGVKLDDCTDKPNFDQNPNACRWRVSMIPASDRLRTRERRLKK